MGHSGFCLGNDCAAVFFLFPEGVNFKVIARGDLAGCISQRVETKAGKERRYTELSGIISE